MKKMLAAILLIIFIGIICPFIVDYLKKNVKIRFDFKNKIRINWRAIGIIYAAILMAANFVRIFNNSFWGDEAFSILLSRKSVPEILAGTANDVHPPLYYLFLHGMYCIFGDAGWVTHLTSFIPYVAVTIFILTIVWKKWGGAVGMFMLTMTSLSNEAFIYNLEARMYSLTAMFVLFAFYGFYLLCHRDKKGIPVFIICSLGAAYSHYYGLFAVALLYLSLIVLVATKRMELKTMLAMWGVTILGYIPWLRYMISTFQRTAGDFWMSSYPSIKECIYFIFTSSKSFYSNLMIVSSLLVLICFMAVEIGLCVVKKDKREHTELTITDKNLRLSNDGIFVGVGYIAPFLVIVIGVLISTFIRPALTYRYIYPVVMLVWLSFAVALSKIDKKRVIIGLLIVLSLFVYVPHFKNAVKGERAEDKMTNETISYLRENVDSKDIVLTNVSHLDWTVFDYYIPGLKHQKTDKKFNDYISGKSDEYYGKLKLKNKVLVWDHKLSDEEKEKITRGRVELKLVKSGKISIYGAYVYKVKA